ncbi:MAG: hypothetical protein JJ979_06485 [Roseibium sp.]|nr:hypothetical protein [Roseibium sp.]
MMRQISEYVQFFWMFESHAQQRLAWEDAAEARIARVKAEEAAALQLQAMLDANPSGSLGHSILYVVVALQTEGLL